jgi:hypothetical protein
MVFFSSFITFEENQWALYESRLFFNYIYWPGSAPSLTPSFRVT